MRFSAVWRFVGVLVVGASAMLPASVAAQQIQWVVLHEPANLKQPFNVLIADCGKVNAALASQKLTCTLTQSATPCQPCTASDPTKCQGQKGVCPFVVSSSDLPPAALIFGYSASSPGCGYVWDPYRQQYVYRCW